jgi:glutathione synthase/RimK-type ligase-like ATP-grasp enzyme
MIVSEKVKIQEREGPPNTSYVVQICETLFMKWSLSESKKYLLQCGEFSTHITFHPIPQKDHISIERSLLKEMRLPLIRHNICLYFHQDLNIISLGIIIGVLTEVRETEDGPNFGSVHDFCKELAVYCERNDALFYVFSLKKHSNNLHGYVWNGDMWELHDVPFPHVVHNRIHSRKRERSKEYLQLTTTLRDQNIPFFNDHFLNKWESYEHLVNQDHLHPFLPETQLLLNHRTLEEFLQRHDRLFIKPIHGSQGKKIIRIENKDGEYILDYTTFSGEIEKSYSHSLDLFQAIRPRISKSAYIVQQGISLLAYKNRILDFRFLCHLNDKNEWKVTSSVARISSKNEFVSNIARGGEIQKVTTILKELLDPREAADVYKMLHELALEVASSIGQSEEGLFGELGIDLALDTQAKPWIIEVNTKPSKNMDGMDTTTVSVRPSSKAIINYCLYLANPFKRSELP